jgi:protein-disulfide isomerase/uncharacterized membrane protein
VDTSAGKRIVAALVLCAAAAGVAGLLLLQHHGEPRAVATVSQVCGEGEASGCDQVAHSAWSRVLGFPVAAWGLAFYLSLTLLLLLALVGPGELLLPLALVALLALASALLVDVVLLGLQAFAIHAFCRLCLLTYLLGLASFAALWPARRGAAEAGPKLARPEGRLALAGAAAGALAILAFVVAANATLRHREADRTARLLGAPAPANAAAAQRTPQATPPPALVAPPATEPVPPEKQDAAYWREQAQKLQATLDDPQKLEAYFAAKAQHEYDAATPALIDLANTPVRGPADAPVTVVVYSDFLCPYCRQLGQALTGFMPQAGGRIKVYYKNYPLDSSCNSKLTRSVHAGSCALALGGLCAFYQGKFDAYHDRVFAGELQNPQPADVVRLAGEAGLNAAAVEGCLEDPKTKAALAAQVAEGNRLGVTSTPTIYIDGKKLPRINDFVAIIDKEARKKGLPPLAH